MATRTNGERSPVAERIRTRIREMGTSESKIAEALGVHRAQLSHQLRRLDEGGNLRGDTIARLAKILGKTEQWILTGQETEGALLSADPRWASAAREAREAYGLDASTVDAVGSWRPPSPPKRLDGAYVLLVSHAQRHGT